MSQAASRYVAAVWLWFLHNRESADKAASLNNTAAEPAEKQWEATVEDSRETEETGLNSEEQRQAAVQEATVKDSRETEETGLNSEETSVDMRAAVLAEYEQILGQFVSGRVGCFFCTHPKCSYTSSKRVHVAKHAESRHIQGYSVSCLACSEVFPTCASYGRHSCHVKHSSDSTR